MTRNLCLLVGSGAEAGIPFNLPIGNAFTWKTCYTKNTALYKALDAFYGARLPKKSGERDLPLKYQGLFLYEKTNPEFKKLVAAIAQEEKEGPETLRDFLDPFFSWDSEKIDEFASKARSCKLGDESYGAIFDQLIADAGDGISSRSSAIRALKTLPKDAYFGTIETYFSSILNPARRNRQFWKLVNYYWSAFFSVAEPLIRRAYSGEKELTEKELYTFTLENLSEVVYRISEPTLFNSKEIRGTYYGQLKGHFDSVITTNYTSLSCLLGTEPIYISGSLRKFESPESLTVRDIVDTPVANDEFVFPYLMTQAPIKPIICAEQVKDLVRMYEALEGADDLVVLGYSFCPSDAHVASIVGSWLCGKASRRLHFFFHAREPSDVAPNAGDICKLLRINVCYSERILTYPSSEIKSVVDSLRD